MQPPPNPLQQANSPFVQNLLGLWVPRPHAKPQGRSEEDAVAEQPAIIRFAITTVGWKELTGQQATIDSVLERLRKYSLEQVMGLVARITLALNGGGSADFFVVQLQIAERFLGAEGARVLVNLVRSKETVEHKLEEFALFHERQILNALKLALLGIDYERIQTDDNSNVLHFVEALLMVNDLIDPPEGSMGPNTPGGSEAMELYISANMLFNESPSMLEDLVRAHYLYIEHRPEISGRGAIDVPATLALATGLDSETTWRALNALYAFWGASKLDDIDSGAIAVKRSHYLSTLPMLSEDQREVWFSLASWNADDLQARIRRDYTLSEPRYWDVLPFEERPLIAFGDVLYCASVPLLRRLAGSSIQHRLQDPNRFSTKETRAFRDTRGHLVEHYTEETLKRAFGDRFIPESELRTAANGASVCDGLIVYPEGVILFESKAASPLLDTRQGKNYAKYRAQWQGLMRKAATQLNSTIELLRSGAFGSLGITAEMLRDFFPVVGVFEQPVHPLTYRVVRQTDLANHPLTEKMRSGIAKPLQLLQIEEVDMWELASERGKSVLDLLKKKTSTEEMTEISFHHFLHLSGETFQNNHSRWHGAQFSKISDDALEYYRKLGMTPADDA